MDTSYLSQQVTTIIERLHGFFDEIGVPSHERDSRESEVGNESDYTDMIQD
jgi:protein regulator of cytokinesis 1